MKNPWNSNPVIICATPVVAGLLQVIILGYSTGFSDSVLRKNINDTVTVAALFLPLVSIPAVWAAVSGIKTKILRSWYVAGAVLNSAYCLLLSVPIQTISAMFLHSAKK
jgi:hypothetical protein